MANNIVSSGLWENVILTIDGTTDCAKKGTWWQDVRHQIGDVAEFHTYHLLMLYTQCVGSLHCLSGWCCRLCVVGLIDLGGRVSLRWRSGVLKKTSSQMWCTWYLPMCLLRDGSLTLMNIASSILLAIVCDSLPTIEKMSYLV